MKKRKPPIVLATILVLMLIAVPILYPRQGGSGDGHGHEEQPAPPPPTAEKGDRPKLKTTDVAGMASGVMSQSRPQPKMGGPGGMMPPSDKPSISMPKQTNFKPTPNESSTSTQWYTDQTKK